MIEKTSDFSGLSGVLSPLLPLLFVDFQFSENESDGLFVQKCNGEITAFFSVRNGCSNLIRVSGECDIEEILSFYRFIGIKNLISDFKLNDSSATYSLLSADTEKKSTVFAEALTSASSTEAYLGVFNLLCSADSSFCDWYPSFSKRINSGKSAAVYKEKEDTIVSCAVSPAVFEKKAVIGGVFTDSSFRREGLGSECVKALLNNLCAIGVKEVVLWCEDRNILFYQKLGFSIIGQVFISEDF